MAKPKSGANRVKPTAKAHDSKLGLLKRASNRVALAAAKLAKAAASWTEQERSLLRTSLSPSARQSEDPRTHRGADVLQRKKRALGTWHLDEGSAS